MFTEIYMMLITAEKNVMQNLFTQQVVILGALCALHQAGQMGYKAKQVEVTLPSQSLEVGSKDVTGSNLSLGDGEARNDLPEKGTFYPRPEEPPVSIDHLWK